MKFLGDTLRLVWIAFLILGCGLACFWLGGAAGRVVWELVLRGWEFTEGVLR